MTRWLATVSFQLRAKSYPFVETVRVSAGSPSTAACRAVIHARLQLAGKLNRRHITDVTVKLHNLGRETDTCPSITSAPMITASAAAKTD